jgi:hypothetical protein
MAMNIANLGALATVTVALIGATSITARAQTYWDVEAARANARAGGPTIAYDADLLERYGCLSGTRSAFCQRLNRGEARRYYRQPRRAAR